MFMRHSYLRNTNPTSACKKNKYSDNGCLIGRSQTFKGLLHTAKSE